MNERKMALVAFNGEMMCFAHVLLNALDMAGKGFDVKVVIEGKATGLLVKLTDEQAPFSDLFRKVRDAGLIDCACRACSAQTNATEAARALGIELAGDMEGHPSLSAYLFSGYEVITF
ncbi:DsrE family protein [Candidatus Mcinerneyibacteriota bacterium]|nr:DsrE family protein [Candidatus Mcinerneyibacteriota bacterium]